MKSIHFFAIYTLACLVFVWRAYGGGYQLYSESSAEILATAGAVVGRQDIKSLPWYNPAGSTSVERPYISGGGSLLRLGIDYSSPHGGHDRMEPDIRYTGFCYAVYPCSEDVYFTFSANAPYGMITHWKSGWQEDTLSTFTSIRNLYITPNLALKINDELSVAAGFNFVYSVARVARMLPGNDAVGLPRNKMYLRADGVGFGYTFSVHYKPFEHWGFGAHYQSRAKVKLEGKSDFRHNGEYAYGLVSYADDDVDTTLTIPSSFAMGVANTSFDKWTLSFDALWTEWTLYDAMVINFKQFPTKKTPGTSYGTRAWKDSWSLRFGAEYQLNDKWALRFGYMFDDTPSNSKYNSPEMPDSDKNYFSLGFCYDTGDWAFDAGYAFVKFNKAPMGSRLAYQPANGRGVFDTDCHIVSFQYTLRF